MSRTVQKPGSKGSLKWIQRAVGERWPGLDDPILARIPRARSIEWRSPLVTDDYAEYRDEDFLNRLDIGHLAAELRDFWPSRGPQWDALGRTDTGQLLLVEAKSHVAEMCSPGTAAATASKERITARLKEVAGTLGVRSNGAAWTDFFYQLANRLAHLQFLRDQDQPAYLVLVNFLNDAEMDGPETPEAWEAAYEVAFHVMGLPRRHKLSRYVIEVFPDVAGAKDANTPA
ncbi:hypothetical protein FFK22_031335 [Mycobacterium sp. KBS0706]|uniref:hypothetical protein n=1 Tax=Mycobacterium sp. KBS0706 TaxID=2578109 RepID=UPI00110FCEF6|nr:hypothetical protein [Mycobacterium sp. KBS0706]TSD84711.1 hypothetical protein FFK22_031335 [Mycobacterium sp. KBS0706]